MSVLSSVRPGVTAGAPEQRANGAERRERAITESHPDPDMSGRAGSTCPECGGQLQSVDGGMNYRCRDCDREFDSADVFLI